MNLELVGNARIENGALIVDGKSMAQSGSLPKTLTAKTLEAWVQLDDLKQQGGGAGVGAGATAAGGAVTAGGAGAPDGGASGAPAARTSTAWPMAPTLPWVVDSTRAASREALSLPPRTNATSVARVGCSHLRGSKPTA